jgi:hypothetical protein
MNEGILTMITAPVDMKLEEALPDALTREVLKIDYRKIDKHGRMYIDVKAANTECIMVLLEPVPEDKIRFFKAGR